LSHLPEHSFLHSSGKELIHHKYSIILADTYRHKGLRRKLISSLRNDGIKDEQVLEAMERIPRHLFLDKAFEEWAYRDIPFPIGNEQTISQPFTVAFQTQLLEVRPKDKILEIGTGSGYQACVLYEMGAKVYSVERVKPLFDRTHEFLQKIGYNGIRTFLTDGNGGLPRYQPYDGILVTAGSTDVPQALLDQLAVGGKLVIPVGGDNVQKMLRFTREASGKYRREEFGDFRFVPFLSGIDRGDGSE
jgi:protein-L-isoaspartate(D-aspartate) O-methyltransferase